MANRAPRRFLRDPDEFGRPGSSPSWQVLPEETPGELAAAFVQHRIAQAVEAQLSIEGASQDRLAEWLDEPAETVRRKLRGITAARLSEILAWAMLLGSDVLSVVPGGREEFFPSEVLSRVPDWSPGERKLPRLSPVAPQDLDWTQVAVGVAARVAERERLGRAHLVDRYVIREALVEMIVEAGVDPEMIWIDRQAGGQQGVDITLDAPPAVSINIGHSPSQPDSPYAAARGLSGLVHAIVRSATGDVALRLVVIVCGEALARRFMREVDLAGDGEGHQAFSVGEGGLARLVAEDAAAAEGLGSVHVEGRVLSRVPAGPSVVMVLAVDKLSAPGPETSPQL